VSDDRHLFFDQAWFEAFRALAAEDLPAARRVMVAVNALARDPEPADSYHWGGSSVYRLHVGNYRILYEVDDETVRVWSLGRLPR
jgi:mRNA-degrading endonuclease RelE of RelBE toxin-antitoxin system